MLTWGQPSTARFYISGRAVLVEGPALRRRLEDQFVTGRAQFHVSTPAEEDAQFELLVDRCLLTRTAGHGDTDPRHEVWVAGRSGPEVPA